MPFINNSTGFQIHGGTFYEVSGDVSLETHQHLSIQDTRHDAGLRLPVASTLTLGEDWDVGSHRELSSVARNPRHETGGRPAPNALPSRPHLGLRGSSTVGEHAHRESGSNASSAQPRLGLCPVPERVTELAPPAPLPSLDPVSSDLQISHLGDYPHSNNLANIASLPPRLRQNYHILPSRNTVQSASCEPGPQGPHYRGDPVNPESRSKDRLAHFSAEPPQAIHGGTFISAENINHHPGETGLHILHRAVTLDALYDSAESFPQPRCHPQTRTGMLDTLYRWNTANSIYWLSGPAGAGKSAIMQTLCQQLQDAGRLGGSFFFKRGHSTRGNAKALFVTLAYQLALHHPKLKGPISKSTEDNPSVVGRGMDIQLRQLIIEPCAALTNSAVIYPPPPPPPTIILLIDGLDECKGHNVQQEILHLLGSAVSQCPMLRILIASRPEPQISQVFREPGMTGLHHLLDIGPSFMDIRNYLLSEFN
ncbi:hypothetical protein FB451DRAFT_181083 [Mycena latifolia]|nr:hypothetical protein FB451DRAFT_181083 [Mycena latifolia]